MNCLCFGLNWQQGTHGPDSSKISGVTYSGGEGGGDLSLVMRKRCHSKLHAVEDSAHLDDRLLGCVADRGDRLQHTSGMHSIRSVQLAPPHPHPLRPLTWFILSPCLFCPIAIACSAVAASSVCFFTRPAALSLSAVSSSRSCFTCPSTVLKSCHQRNSAQGCPSLCRSPVVTTTESRICVASCASSALCLP